MSGATAAPDAVKAFRAMQVGLQSRLIWLTLFRQLLDGRQAGSNHIAVEPACITKFLKSRF